jgi:hypothetical protein
MLVNEHTMIRRNTREYAGERTHITKDKYEGACW